MVPQERSQKLPRTVCALVLAALAVGAGAADFISGKPVERVEQFQKRQREIAAYLQDTRDLSAVRIVFIGDSITDNWCTAADLWNPGQIGGLALWKESFSGQPPENLALNIGITGDHTENVLHRILPKSAGGLGELDRPDLQPEFVVLMIGINNSWGPEYPIVDSVYAGIQAVVDAVHARKPAAIVVLQSLLPNKEAERNRDIVMPVNRRLALLAASSPYRDFVEFLDLYPHFVDGTGAEISSLFMFMDGVHPNESGYRVWRDALVPALQRIRAARGHRD